MSTGAALASPTLRVGEVARQTGTTVRTIRYYEEIGLLAADAQRRRGGHRVYSSGDVDRIREVMRLRDLLGLSLEQLSTLLEVETVREDLRRQWDGAADVAEQRRILEAARQCADTQLALLRDRRSQLAALERQVRVRRDDIDARLSDLGVRRADAS